MNSIINRVSIIAVFVCLFWGQATLASVRNNVELRPRLAQHRDAWQGHLLIAEAKQISADKKEPRSGSLLLPENNKEDGDGEEDKKCMTVCNRWGEDCIFDTQRGRKCRRTCKEFGEECF